MRRPSMVRLLWPLALAMVIGAGVTFTAGPAAADRHGVSDVCPDGPDVDDDGVCDAIDNCPNAENPDQADGDGDGSATPATTARSIPIVQPARPRRSG